MLGLVANTLSDAPARIAYSLSVIVRSVFVLAAFAGTTAVTLLAADFANRLAPALLSGHTVDVAGLVTGQLRTLMVVALKLQAFAEVVLEFVGAL